MLLNITMLFHNFFQCFDKKFGNHSPMPWLNDKIKIALLPALIVLLGTGIWCGVQSYQNTKARVDLKKDYSIVNSITYGVFSPNSWKNEVKAIIDNRIDEFEFSNKQDSLVRVQIHVMLDQLISRIKTRINKDNDQLEDKLRKVSVNLIVDWEDLRSQVPAYTNAIMKELKKERSKNRLKAFLHSKLDELAAKTYDHSDSLRLHQIYGQYNKADRVAFNAYFHNKKQKLRQEGNFYTYALIGIILILPILWIVCWQQQHLHPLLFISSVLLGLIVLITGLSSPMIAIDARVDAFEFILLGKTISFQDQILFYRSKSILEVVQLLLKSKSLDSILVGFLVLAFSVLLPFAKLAANGLYLFSSSGIRHNQIIHWLTFNSGKWSMADVLIIAIFMAYIGFDGMIASQMDLLTFDNAKLSTIATNETSLLPGFTLFLSFVIFSLILSEILSRITKKQASIAAKPNE